jgi:hypothetical protein
MDPLPAEVMITGTMTNPEAAGVTAESVIEMLLTNPMERESSCWYAEVTPFPRPSFTGQVGPHRTGTLQHDACQLLSFNVSA